MRPAIFFGIALFLAAPAAAQLQSQIVVSGLDLPVAYVQDPALADTQYVVEQRGRIRVVRGGALAAADFLDLRANVACCGERGLLGLAFAPDYATSGRSFVNFINSGGHTVIARFTRSTGDPRRADPGSRFDLRWPDGNRFITQPYTNHNGGGLQFGPDGYLYVGLGDGGSGSDPGHLAQTPSTLLGKFLRIDVNVPQTDQQGYGVPATNPFVGRAGYLAEIWSFGWRNPWRYSFDSFGAGATGALIVGDVGQGDWEEIDYEPADQGGRNYGWRNREGAHDHATSRPAAYVPLRDPIHEYGHATGQTVIGGYVYRGAALGGGYTGRYFFADYVTPRVWSIALGLDGAGEATAADLQEHTAELGGSTALGNISSFGIDADGELHLVSHSRGEIRRIVSANRPSQMIIALDAPAQGTLVQPFSLSGWAIDRAQIDATPGVDTVHVWAFPLSGGSPVFLGAAHGGARPDVAAVYGAAYANSGYDVTVTGLPAGDYVMSAHPHSTVTGRFEGSARVQVAIVTGPAMALDAPAGGAIVPARFGMSGWAVDRDSRTGTGVDTIHVWGYPISGEPRFVGAAAYGSARPDVAAVFGSRFANSGWTLTGTGLTAGTWTLVAAMRSTATGTFRLSSVATVHVRSGALVQVDIPPPSTVTRPFRIVGWAVDVAAASGTGVSAIHAWAFPVGGGGGVFVGAGTLGLVRTDVGAVFGAQFEASGYELTWPASVPPGVYDLVVYAQSSVSGTFDTLKVVRLTVN